MRNAEEFLERFGIGLAVLAPVGDVQNAALEIDRDVVQVFRTAGEGGCRRVDPAPS